jgi:hypothetical protein
MQPDAAQSIEHLLFRGERYILFLVGAVVILSWWQPSRPFPDFGRRILPWRPAQNVSRKPALTIIVHTSRKTASRIDTTLRRYKVDLPGVHYFCVIATKVPYPGGIPVIETPCVDTRDGADGLVCRDIYAYQYFVDHPELGDYLFRIMDDSYLNVTNLLKLISKLNEVYDPSVEIIFRGFANDEYPRTYLGGGSGWLMSRPLVKLHNDDEFSFRRYFHHSHAKQDDTTETIIIDRIFEHVETWNDPLWLESCSGCRASEWERGDFSRIAPCPKNIATWPLSSIISFHPRSDLEATAAGHMLGSLPTNLCHYHWQRTSMSRLCWREPNDTRSFEPTAEAIRLHAIYETIDSIRAHARPANLERSRWLG